MRRIVKITLVSITAIFFIQMAAFSPVPVASQNSDEVKELNFVFLHGMGSTPCTLQLLSDEVKELVPLYEARYRAVNPDITLEVNMLSRCFPGYVDIDTWARNVTDAINTHFRHKKNLILVGHSMGGKTALYAVANDIGGLSDKVAAVITINSPIRSLSRYYVPGGGPMFEYCRATLLGSDDGVCGSIADYDSSDDGALISRTKNWLAFISSEPAPLSQKYDTAGVDAWPRNMDDGTVPLPAQFTEDADTIYYGEYGHSEMALEEAPGRFIADRILRYIFGDPIETSVVARNGSFEHEADWLLGTDRWTDVVGGLIADSGRITHTNNSFYEWEEWEDVIGKVIEGDKKAYSQVRSTSLPFITSVKAANWLNPDDESDLRIKVNSQAAPLTSIKIDWAVYKSGIFPAGNERTFYDIEMSEGTPLAGVRYAAWLREEANDPVLWIWSEAQSPFRWFKAEWSIYQQEIRVRNIIDSIPVTGS